MVYVSKLLNFYKVSDLLDEELKYELKIRGLELKRNLTDNLKALKEEISKEKSRGLDLTKHFIEIDPVAEINECSTRHGKISKLLNESFDSERVPLESLKSNLIHLLFRLGRIFSDNPRILKLRNNQLKIILTTLVGAFPDMQQAISVNNELEYLTDHTIEDTENSDDDSQNETFVEADKGSQQIFGISNDEREGAVGGEDPKSGINQPNAQSPEKSQNEVQQNSPKLPQNAPVTNLGAKPKSYQTSNKFSNSTAPYDSNIFSKESEKIFADLRGGQQKQKIYQSSNLMENQNFYNINAITTDNHTQIPDNYNEMYKVYNEMQIVNQNLTQKQRKSSNVFEKSIVGKNVKNSVSMAKHERSRKEISVSATNTFHSDIESSDSESGVVTNVKITNLQKTLKRWNLSFSGKNDTILVKEFVKRVEFVTSAEGFEKRDLMSCLGVILKGDALDFFFMSYKKFESWKEFKKALIRKFTPPALDDVVEQQILEKRQGKFQPFGEYVMEMEKLFSKLSYEMSPDQKMRKIVRNARYSCRNAVVYRPDVDSLEKLEEVCQRVDDMELNIFTNKKYNSYQTQNIQNADNDNTTNYSPRNTQNHQNNGQYRNQSRNYNSSNRNDSQLNQNLGMQWTPYQSHINQWQNPQTVNQTGFQYYNPNPLANNVYQYQQFPNQNSNQNSHLNYQQFPQSQYMGQQNNSNQSNTNNKNSNSYKGKNGKSNSYYKNNSDKSNDKSEKSTTYNNVSKND